MRWAALLFFVFGVMAPASPEPLVIDLPQVPNGGYQAAEIPFPSIIDPSTLRMTFERGHCVWGCPSYRVEIRGDGSVLFDGDEGVVIAGPHRTTIPKASVDRLLALFRKTRFFSLLDEYSAP